MGYIFKELIHKFSEMSSETAGEHFTPREVIRVMISMLFTLDMGIIYEPGFMAKNQEFCEKYLEDAEFRKEIDKILLPLFHEKLSKM